MTFDQLFQLLVLAVVVIVFWWTHRSFPPQQTAELIQQLMSASKQTQTRVDDVLVEIASLLNTLRERDDESSIQDNK